MINGIQLKICGITNVADAKAADLIGTDFLGFNLYPKSPRYIPLATFVQMEPQLPQCKRVAVMVRPSVKELSDVSKAGFDFFQLHFDPETDHGLVESWSGVIGSERLWLAPRLATCQPFPEWLMPIADTFLIDTYRKELFGGSGATGDWDRFHKLRSENPKKLWILAGGLKPENITQALVQSEAQAIDVNSGVELCPGIKDPEKLEALSKVFNG